MVRRDQEVHGGWEPHLGTSLWAACLGPPATQAPLSLSWDKRETLLSLSPFASPSVLPKFEMTIDLPAVVLEKDKKFQMEICGR